MSKIDVRKQGRYFTLNGEIVKPDRFYGIDGFKWANHVWAWIRGGAFGEGGGVHLDRARRYIEREVLGNGCRRMRAPVELMYWGPPYFDLIPWEENGQTRQAPEPFRRPNVANVRDLVDLHVGGGSAYRMTSGMKKLIRMYVVLAREFDIIIEVPWLWTIKGPGIPIWLEGEPDASDPRGEGQDIASWNEHFLGNDAEGVCVYLRKLRLEGDGEGEDRVDPGGLNLLSDAMNEYTAHSVVWNQAQLRNVARRWHERNGQGELLLISQSGPADRYDPPLASQHGASGFDGVCLHPPRDDEWERSGAIARARWPNELIDFNESQMGWTEEERALWVPLIPKWERLGSTDMGRWARMHEVNVENDVYTTFHTRRGMDAYWPETPQNAVEETIRSITGAAAPPPPPPGPDPPPPGPEPPPPPPPPPPGSASKLEVRRNDEKELVIERDPEVVKGGDEAHVLLEAFGLVLPPGRRLERLHVFHGLDRGDIVEMDTEIHANGKTLYVRSEHKETSAPFDAWETWDPHEDDFDEEIRNIEISVLCRVNGKNGAGKLEARPHWGIRFVFE